MVKEKRIVRGENERGAYLPIYDDEFGKLNVEEFVCWIHLKSKAHNDTFVGQITLNDLKKRLKELPEDAIFQLLQQLLKQHVLEYYTITTPPFGLATTIDYKVDPDPENWKILHFPSMLDENDNYIG